MHCILLFFQNRKKKNKEIEKHISTIQRCEEIIFFFAKNQFTRYYLFHNNNKKIMKKTKMCTQTQSILALNSNYSFSFLQLCSRLQRPTRQVLLICFSTFFVFSRKILKIETATNRNVFCKFVRHHLAFINADPFGCAR